MLDPPGAGVNLPMFFLRAGDEVAIRIEDCEAGAGRALIDRANVSGHGRYSSACCWSLVGPWSLASDLHATKEVVRFGESHAENASENPKEARDCRHHGSA